VARAGHPNNPKPEKKGFGRSRMAFYDAVGGHFTGVTIASSMGSGGLKFFVKPAQWKAKVQPHRIADHLRRSALGMTSQVNISRGEQTNSSRDGNPQPLGY
jgi:hypothetical protein